MRDELSKRNATPTLGSSRRTGSAILHEGNVPRILSRDGLTVNGNFQWVNSRLAQRVVDVRIGNVGHTWE